MSFDKPFVMMQQLPALLKLKSYKSVYSLVSSYIKNEKLRRMLSMHPLLVGEIHCYNFYLWTNFILGEKMGNSLFNGRNWKYYKRFEKLMNEVGIKIIKGKEVTKIITNNKKISGIKLNDQNIINSQNVICNADPPTVYENVKW